jgi:exopolysaccharide production protein ExoZ
MQNIKLQNLQILRGISAILVCCFHARTFLNGDIQFGEILFVKGSIGVPIFFILSGFIMVYTTKELSKNTFENVKDFFIKRIIRVVPLYYFCTILFLFITEIRTFIDDGFIRVLKVFLFIPIGKMPPLYVGWTLNFEMFFYLLFGISLIFNKRRYFFLYFIFLILIFILPLSINRPIVLNSYKGQQVKTYLDLITNPLLLQFLLGVFLGNTVTKLQLNTTKLQFLVTFSILVFILYYFNFYSFFQSDLIICGLLVFSVILLDQSKIKFSSPRALIYLGDISYSIYLVHPIMIVFLPQFFMEMGLTRLINQKYIFLLILAFTLLSSAILYEFIEKRVTEYLKEKIIKKRSLPNHNI